MVLSERIGMIRDIGGITGSVRTILEEHGIDDAASEADLIAETVTGMDAGRRLCNSNESFNDGTARRLREIVEKRLGGCPLQYILGESWFYGRKYVVSPAVFIPRYDTEVLVTQALEMLTEGMSVLDIGTGSGCVIITLALEKKIRGCGTDISVEALRIAKKNNERYNAGCRCIQGDLFPEQGDCFDMIVSNPPYIRSGVIGTLQREVREHEPRLALDGGEDGLDFYRRIASGANSRLKEGGLLLFEIGYDQALPVSKILAENGFVDISTVSDLNGLNRVLKARKQRCLIN